MNWKLIGSLSGFGMAMGIASVFGLTAGKEGFLWLLIGIFCAYWIARSQSAKFFHHGFLVGLLSGIVAPIIQAIFFSTYLANNPESAAQFNQLPAGLEPRLFTLILAPIIGLISGLFLGLFAIVASKLMKKSS